MTQTPLTDAAWRGMLDDVDDDDQLAPFINLRTTSRTIERELAAMKRSHAALLEALTRAAENMKAAALFHHCKNCSEGAKLARAAITAAEVKP